MESSSYNIMGEDKCSENYAIPQGELYAQNFTCYYTCHHIRGYSICSVWGKKQKNKKQKHYFAMGRKFVAI